MLKQRWVGPLILIAMLVYGLIVYPSLPERVPIHWNVNGVADNWGSREMAIFFTPLLGALLWALFMVAPRLDPLTITSPERFSYAPFMDTILRYGSLMMIFMAVIHVITLGIAMGWPIQIGNAIMVAIGFLFAALGNEMGRLKRNSFAGIRMPWTLANEEVWRISHRVGGRAMVATGLLSALAGIVLPQQTGFIVLMVLVFGWTFFTLGYSYWVSRQVASRAAPPTDPAAS